HRADPCGVGCSPTGLTYIDTQMTMLSLTGTSSVFGPVHIRESPSRPSLGRTQQQQASADFPADSFFDVFVEIDTSQGVLHNEQPMHMQSVINAIPPYGDPYRLQNAPISLLNSNNQVIGHLDVAKHIAVRPNSTFVIFRNHQ